MPRPPNRLVPAITGPAMASSSKSPAPEDWFTASRREAAMIPPIAAMRRAIMNTDDPDARDPDARAPGRLGVAADREDVAAEAWSAW